MPKIGNNASTEFQHDGYMISSAGAVRETPSVVFPWKKRGFLSEMIDTIASIGFRYNGMREDGRFSNRPYEQDGHG